MELKSYGHPQEVIKIDERQINAIERHIEGKFRKRISALEYEIERLKKAAAPDVIVLQEVTYAEAKSMVEEYLKNNKTAYISEIVDDLRLDLKTVHQIIEELEKENKIC